jgi:hypothetical protein
MNRRRCTAAQALAGLLALGAAFAASAAAIRPFVPGSMAQIRAAHADVPHLVVLWSLDCPPCHEELATLGRFVRHHPELRLVLISTDTPEATAQLTGILQRHGLAGAQAWVFADEFVERLRHEIDPAWSGVLPRSYLHAPGASARAVSGKLDRTVLENWWRALARVQPAAAQAGN